MEKRLLTIDWDYFMPYIGEMNTSYLENKRNIERHWYKMYLENKQIGKDITTRLKTGDILDNFWDKLRLNFYFKRDTKLIVSDSHKIAYDIVKDNECTEVCNIDSHTDLGYGGIPSLDFEVNCANWLGKLFKDKIIRKSNIILSPYSVEKPADFKEINNKYNIEYNDRDINMDIDIVHICRSGAWTAPWLDNEFYKFINDSNLEYEIIDCEKRVWDADNIQLSKQIECMLF